MTYDNMDVIKCDGQFGARLNLTSESFTLGVLLQSDVAADH